MLEEEKKNPSAWGEKFKKPVLPDEFSSSGVCLGINVHIGLTADDCLDDYVKMREFLRANGHTRDNLNFCEEGNDDSVDEEKPPFKDPKEAYKTAVEKEKMTWQTLKNRKIVWNGRSYPNPFVRRTEYGWLGKSETPFLLEIREKRKFSHSLVTP
jgi:hypothetical protein